MMKIVYFTAALLGLLVLAWVMVPKTINDHSILETNAEDSVLYPENIQENNVAQFDPNSTIQANGKPSQFAPRPALPSMLVQSHQYNPTNVKVADIPKELVEQINISLENNLTLNDLPSKKFTDGRVVIPTAGRLKTLSSVSLNAEGELVFHEHKEPITVKSN